MKKFNQFSLIDFLVNIFPPELKIRSDTVDPKIVQSLYDIWKNPKNKIGNKVYKKPNNVSNAEVEGLVSSGLVSRVGDRIQITHKGGNVIKTMILGDDRSSYEYKDKDIDYVTASNNIKKSTRLRSKKNSDLWWRILDEK